MWKSGLLPAGLVFVVLPMWALVLFWAYPLAWIIAVGALVSDLVAAALAEGVTPS